MDIQKHEQILIMVVENGRVEGDTVEERQASLVAEVEFEAQELGLSPVSSELAVQFAIEHFE